MKKRHFLQIVVDSITWISGDPISQYEVRTQRGNFGYGHRAGGGATWNGGLMGAREQEQEQPYGVRFYSTHGLEDASVPGEEDVDLMEDGG